jgi:opacity protein-like surface antigen
VGKFGWTKVLFAGAVAIVGLAVAGSAQAQYVTPQLLNSVSCSDAVYGTNGSFFQGNNTYPSRGAYTPNCAPGHTSNAPGSVVTAVTTLRAATTQTNNLIASRISNLRSAARTGAPVTVALDANTGMVGLAGGDKNRGMGFWAQGAFTHVDNDQVALNFDGFVLSGLFGLDKMLMNDRLILGLSAGFERIDMDTTFNLGNLEGNGLVISPYASFMINDKVDIDFNAGYARIAYDMDRRDPITSELFSGETDGDRFFGALTARYSDTRGKLLYGAHLGARYSHESRSSFTETGTIGTTVAVGSQSIHLGQAVLGANLGYDLGMFKPYVTGQGEFDFSKSDDPTVAANQTQPSDSNVGLRLGLGTEIDFAPNVTGTIELDGVLLRDDYNEYGGRARIRVEF